MGLEVHQPDLLGNFADVYVGQTENGRPYVRKLLGLKRGGYTLEEANNGVELMDRFVTIADEIGLPIGRIYEHSVQQLGDNDRYSICQLQEYLGRDLGKILSEEPDVEVLINGYLNCCDRVRSSGFQIALDPHVPNFCVDTNGVVKYIDIMPPRQILDGDRVAIFPRVQPDTIDPYFLDRCFTSDGQVIDIYAKILKFLATNPFYISPSTPQRIRELIANYFGSGTLERLISGTELNEKWSTQKLTQNDGDVARALGAERYFMGELSAEDLEELYVLTHVSPFGILPQIDNLYRAVTIISS